jgi:hypothetical protein
VSKKPGGKCSLVTYVPHTCPPITHQDFSERNSKWYIARNHARSIIQSRRIKPKDIIDNEAVWRNNRISYRQAHRAIQYQLEKIDGLEEDSFAFFPDYGNELIRVDPETYTRVKLHETTNAFQAIFIALGPLRKAVPHLRHFFAVDGTHTRSKYRMILAVTVALDSNDEVLPICWGLIPRENEYWWSWYCGQMSQAFDSFQQPQSTSEKWVAISDREKGLVTGIENVLPRIEHLHCCQHIADNIYARYGKDCKKLWWPIARAKDPYQREAAMDRLKEKDLKAWQYVKALNTETFSFYHINANGYSRFGHDTSNIVECINSIWGEYRDMPPLMMLDCIYTWTMRRFAKRQSLKAISQTLSNGPYKKFKERMVEAQKYIVTPAGNQVFQVDTPRRHRRRVDLDKHICSCLNFKEYQSPCSHAIACCLYDQDDPFKLFHHGYTLQAYRDTYRHTIQPVTKIHDLRPDFDVKPPQIFKLRGRPHTKRIRKYQWKVTLYKCRTCHQTGHNQRTCRNQPVTNGRAQRIQERQLDSDNDTDSDLDPDFADHNDWLDNVNDEPYFQSLTSEQRNRIITNRRNRVITSLAKEAGLTDDENAIESTDKEAEGLFIRDTLSLPQSQQQEQELEDEDEDEDGDAYERRIQQEIEEERLEEIEQERLRREREDDTESIRSQDTIDSVSRYELWRSEVTQYRCVDTRLLEIDDKGKPLLPEELNSAGRRSIPQGFTAQSDEGVLYRTNVPPRGRRIIDTIYELPKEPQEPLPQLRSKLFQPHLQPKRKTPPIQQVSRSKRRKTSPLPTRRSVRTIKETETWSRVKNQFVKRTRRPRTKN